MLTEAFNKSKYFENDTLKLPKWSLTQTVVNYYSKCCSKIL
jgi:hypothetical protein